MAQVLEADIVGFEAEKDIAVLRVRDRRNLPRPIDVGTSNDLQVGQSVLAVGNPFGLDDTLTTGIVSALGRDVDGIGGRPIHGCIQTDAAINPGNSGGPLLDSRGRLIGVNTAIFSPNGAGNVGIGFAIPVDTVRRVVNQIILYGKVVRPTLGISIVDDRVVRNIGQQLGRSLEGCLVAEVMPNSPARLAGIQATSMSSDGTVVLGDLITGVNGERVRQAEDLISAIEEKNDGEVVTLSVLRKCDPFKSETIRVTLTTRDKLKVSSSTSAATRAGTRGSVAMPWQ
jgi:S1-C subfamily serine protease